MLRLLIGWVALGVAVTAALGADLSASPVEAKTRRVVVIPIRDEIAAPTLFIVRRGLKEAIAQQADVVVLDMKTPGGALNVTLEIMAALEKFPGKTITYVNSEALSAGAFISAATE